jgi:uridylate kinase
MKYKKVLLKLSGEALMGTGSSLHDIETLKRISLDIKEAVDLGVRVCLVVGGGNICRGASSWVERITADYMGMLGTVINSLALKDVMERLGIKTRVLSAIHITNVCEPYIIYKAKRHIEKGRVVIFTAGTGNPFFTTDTAGALRAIEMECDLLLKGTQVDGIYSKDPAKYHDAKRFDKLTYEEVLINNLQVMDLAAISLAKDNKLPVKVFSIKEAGSFTKVLQGKGNFTIVE